MREEKDMEGISFRKAFIVGTIFLFIGIGIQPAFAVEPVISSNVNKEENINPKEFLFQTIIDIANNAEVNELLKQVKNECCNPIRLTFNDVGIHKKLLYNIPKLLIPMFLIKPHLTINYLDFIYNRGCKITNIVRDEKVNEIVKPVEVTNPEFFNELNYIIMNNEELSNRISILKEMNNELITDSSSEDNPIICSILGLIFWPIAMAGSLSFKLYDKFCNDTPITILCLIASSALLMVYILYLPAAYLYLHLFNCYEPYPS
jgi:hypothetical protein